MDTDSQKTLAKNMAFISYQYIIDNHGSKYFFKNSKYMKM